MNPCSSRREALLDYAAYAERALASTEDTRASPLAHIMKPVMNLMAGQPRAKHFRRAIHDAVQQRASPRQCVHDAIAVVDAFNPALLDQAPQEAIAFGSS